MDHGTDANKNVLRQQTPPLTILIPFWLIIFRSPGVQQVTSQTSPSPQSPHSLHIVCWMSPTLVTLSPFPKTPRYPGPHFPHCSVSLIQTPKTQLSHHSLMVRPNLKAFWCRRCLQAFHILLWHSLCQRQESKMALRPPTSTALPPPGTYTLSPS